MSGFGTVKVNGRSLVPNPPTRIKAFIMNISKSLENLFLTNLNIYKVKE